MRFDRLNPNSPSRRHPPQPQATMKIAVSAAALLLGLAQRAEGFACTWNGAGSSYVYRKCASVLVGGRGTRCAQSKRTPPDT